MCIKTYFYIPIVIYLCWSQCIFFKNTWSFFWLLLRYIVSIGTQENKNKDEEWLKTLVLKNIVNSHSYCCWCYYSCYLYLFQVLPRRPILNIYLRLWYRINLDSFFIYYGRLGKHPVNSSWDRRKNEQWQLQRG